MYNSNYINNNLYTPISPIQQPIPQQPIQQSYLVRAVNSIDEGKNVQIDPLNTYILTDLQNNNIYIKRLNNNGLIDFIVFKQVQEQQNYNNYTNNQDLNIINQRLTNIESMLLGGFKNESISTNVSTTTTTNEPATIPERTRNAKQQKSTGD